MTRTERFGPRTLRSVEARALGALSQISRSKRMAVVEPGFAALLEHVRALREDIKNQIEAGAHRSARIIDGLAQEEAAKVLILLDMVRHGLNDDLGVRDHIRAFYNHLSRCVVAEVATYRPASFGELRQAVDRLRRSHYLDGPNDTDWIFRNQLESSREEAMYVDYVKTDEGHAWISPGAYTVPLHTPSRVLDLVLALGRLGATSGPGLRLIAGIWNGHTYQDGDHWDVIRLRNIETVKALRRDGLAHDELDGDAASVVDEWTFPLGQLDLRARAVDIDDLRAEQARALEAMEREWYG